MNAALFSHSMLVIASFFLLLGSGGQAWESMIAYKDELSLFRLSMDKKIEEMADKPPLYTLEATDPALFMYNAIAVILAIPSYVRYLFQALSGSTFLKPFDNYVQAKKKAREADPERQAKIAAPPDAKRVHALKRTALNWAFVMLGSLAALVASMTDLIIGLS